MVENDRSMTGLGNLDFDGVGIDFFISLLGEIVLASLPPAIDEGRVDHALLATLVYALT